MNMSEARFPLDPLFLLHCLSRPPTNDNYIFFSLFLFFFCFFVLKQLGHLREVFTLAICSRCLKEGFHPRIFLFSFLVFFLFFPFFLHHWAASRGFQPKDGTQVPHGGFHRSPYSFFFFFSDL